MKIEKKKSLSISSSPRLRCIKASNFTSHWVQYHTKLKTGDSMTEMSKKECLSLVVSLHMCKLKTWWVSLMLIPANQ